MFLSKFFQQTKPTGIPFSLKTLFDTQKQFKSRRKYSRKEIIKRYEQNPNFKKVSYMKLPNFRSNISFPYNIPIKYRYVYRPVKSVPKISYHDYINFKSMTGNEILINLENPKNLRSTELGSALIELAKKQGARGNIFLIYIHY